MHYLTYRLEAYFSLINPDKLSNKKEWLLNFDQIYNKYGGTEKGELLLAKKLSKKYGDQHGVQLMVAQSKNKHEQQKITNQKKVLSKGISDHVVLDEEWFQLKPSQINSQVTDFTSDKFDPHTTLFNKSLLEIEHEYEYVKNAPRLDNISQAVQLLADFDPLKQHILKINPSSRKQHVQDSNNNDNTKATSSSKIKRVPGFTPLAEQYQYGPLSILYESHIRRKRVRVLIRYVDCIRGTLTGHVLAFDKHLNMILVDVDEVYNRRVTKFLERTQNENDNNDNTYDNRKQQNDEKYDDAVNYEYKNNMSQPEIETFRRKTAVDFIAHNNNTNNTRNDDESSTIFYTRQRHFTQLLVRGDNVVMVWKADSERVVSKHPVKTDTTNVTSNNKNNSEKMVLGTPGYLNQLLQQRSTSPNIRSKNNHSRRKKQHHQQQQHHRRPNYREFF